MAMELPRLEERVAKLEGINSQILERLNHIETRLDEGMEELGGGIGELRKGQWRTVWIVVGTWITILVAILLK